MENHRVIAVVAMSTLSTSAPLLQTLGNLLPTLGQVVSAALHCVWLTASLLFYLAIVGMVLTGAALVVPMMLSIQWPSFGSSESTETSHGHRSANACVHQSLSDKRCLFKYTCPNTVQPMMCCFPGQHSHCGDLIVSTTIHANGNLCSVLTSTYRRVHTHGKISYTRMCTDVAVRHLCCRTNCCALRRAQNSARIH